jgi:hypothetical protein
MNFIRCDVHLACPHRKLNGVGSSVDHWTKPSDCEAWTPSNGVPLRTHTAISVCLSETCLLWLLYFSRSRMGRHKGLCRIRSNVTSSRGPWCEKVQSWGVNPINWRVASRTYYHEIIFIRNCFCCGFGTCRDREWEETRGWLRFDPTRSSAHCMLHEER